VTGDWRKSYSEELHILYSSPHIIMVIKSRRMGWAANVEHMGVMRNLSKIWARKPEGKTPLGKRRLMWDDDFKVDVQEVRCKGMDW